MGLAERLVMKRLGIDKLDERVLEVKNIKLEMKDGTTHWVIPYAVKDYEVQSNRIIIINVKQWYENGEQPPA